MVHPGVVTIPRFVQVRRSGREELPGRCRKSGVQVAEPVVHIFAIEVKSQKNVARADSVTSQHSSHSAAALRCFITIR